MKLYATKKMIEMMEAREHDLDSSSYGLHVKETLEIAQT